MISMQLLLVAGAYIILNAAILQAGIEGKVVRGRCLFNLLLKLSQTF